MTESPLLPFIRRRWWLLAAGALAAGLVAWLVASHTQKTYEAGAKLLVGPVSADYQTVQAAGMIGSTYAELAASRPVAEAAARSARVRLAPDEVEKSVNASSSDVTRIVDVRVRNANPSVAAAIANAIAGQLVQLRRRVPVQKTDPAGPLMHDPALARLPHDQRRSIREAVRRVVWLSHAGDLEIVDAAVPSGTPVAPKTGLLVLVAALGGALVAAVCAVVRDALAGAPREREFQGFEVESFVGSADGDVAADLERWLDEARSEELS
jgi:capsular polysaccharide biosynthesis protein